MAYCASKVVILATGGTIVSSGASATQMTGYSIQGLGVEDLLLAVPMLADVADVEAARVSNIDSSSMTSEVWLKLANAVEEALRREDVSGVVITHGTDTMEETAFFLNLVVKSEKPVVLTGAMRPATALSAEGPLNLLNAVRIASDPKAAGRGVLIALNDVMAIGAMTALRANGIEPGREIGVTGFGDIPYSADVFPPLTTVHLPLAEMVQAAVDSILSNRDDGEATGGTANRLIYVQSAPDVVLRGSLPRR